MIKIKDLNENSRDITLIVRILEKESEKYVITKFGKKARVSNFKVADETGAIHLTLWNEQIDKFNVDDILKITNGYIKRFQNELFLNIGKSGTIKKINNISNGILSHINEKLIHKKEFYQKEENKQITKINLLRNNSKKINVKFKVIKKYEPRKVNTKYGEQIICDFLVGDDTGCIILSLWNNDIYDIALNSYYLLKNAYITSYNNILKLNKGRYGKIYNITSDEAGFSEINLKNNLSSG